MQISDFGSRYKVVFQRKIDASTGDVDMDQDQRSSLLHFECYDPGSRLGKWLYGKGNIGQRHDEIVDRDVRVPDYPVLKEHVKSGVLTHEEVGRDLEVCYLVPGDDIGSHKTKCKSMSAVKDSAVRTGEVVGSRGLSWGFDLDHDQLVLFAPIATVGLTPRQEELLSGLRQD